MKSKRMSLLISGVAVIAVGIYAQTGPNRKVTAADPLSLAVDKGIKWLVSVQGHDGGWGQDGGETSYVRQGERLESSGNDVANTAVAAQALIRAGTTPTSGPYRQQLNLALDFIMRKVEQSRMEGLAVTDQTGTQIQRKLGPYIDTFLTSKLLAELDGNMGNAQSNARVRSNLQKCVAKIEKNQLKDGSWNIAGGWAPILGTSMASQSLFAAQRKGVAVTAQAMDRIEMYSKLSSSPAIGGVPVGMAGGVGGGVVAGVLTPSAGLAGAEMSRSAAGVPLYKSAQELEQLTRTDADRAKNKPQIDAIKSRLADARFVTGFGSVGGEEFFSYLNISDSLRRTGGPEWERWHSDMNSKILKMQNEDGTWAGHHCITGRVAVTGAAILTLLADRESPVVQSTSFKKK